MNFIDSIKSVLNQYATFSGRAPRSEYWFFVLFWILFSTFIELLTGSDALIGAFGLLFLLPSIALTVRRFHDIDFSGGWAALWIIPVLGPLIISIIFLKKGTDGDNQFGPDPLRRHPYLEQKARNDTVS